jgi:hypothetical protein
VHPISEDMALNEKCTCRQARSTRTTNTKAAKIKPIVERIYPPASVNSQERGHAINFLLRDFLSM